MRSRLLLTILSFFLLATPLTAYPFYNWESDHNWLELRGMMRIGAAKVTTPESSPYYTEPDKTVTAEGARLIAQGGVGDSWGYEMNLFQTYPLADTINLPGTERHPALTWSSNDIWVSVDSLYLEYHQPTVNIKLGRQPINLATTYFFTPNDLFAPFGATESYRTYKAGVDAIRADYSWNELSQVSFIATAGYTSDLGTTNGWGDYDSSRSSSLIRATTPIGGTEWSVMAGKVSGERLVAGAFQSELFGTIGFRGEGNRRNNNGSWESQIVIGLDYRWESSLHLQGEIFFNGPGAATTSDYVVGSGSYLANRYLAIGISYTLTPLLSGGVTLLHNSVDHSNFIALNTTYSLSDEGEFSLSISLPAGAKSADPSLVTEFGASATTLVTEVRYYF